MKKKVSSKKDLNSLALSTGAMVTDSSGKKFNSSKKTAHKKPVEPDLDSKKKKITDIKVPEKKVYAEPKALEKKEEVDKELPIIAQKIDDLSRTNAALMAGLMEQIANIKFNATTPILEWEFIVERDNDKNLYKINAKVINTNKILN